MAMMRMAMIEGRAMPMAPTMPPPQTPLQLIADMTRHVDGEDARSGLSHYHDIHELLFVHPLVLVYKFLFHDRYHGVAST